MGAPALPTPPGGRGADARPALGRGLLAAPPPGTAQGRREQGEGTSADGTIRVVSVGRGWCPLGGGERVKVKSVLAKWDTGVH